MSECSRQKRVTLAQIATESGSSIATVSRAISGLGSVREDRRQSIIATAQRLGYLPQELSAEIDSLTFGIIVPSLSNVTFSALAEAFESGCGSFGANVLLGTSNYDPEIEADLIRRFARAGVSGVVLVGQERRNDVLTILKDESIPVVTTISYDDSGQSASVGIDNQAAARSIAEYLMDLGHRRIGVIAGRMAGNDRASLRVEGVRQALAARGLGLPTELLVEQSYRMREGGAALRYMMREKEPPTAIICGNDLLAFGALSECQRLGIDVPGKLSIAGFDDMEFAENTCPSLTSVAVPISQIGQHAADILYSKRLGRNTSETLILPTKLIARGSTGPANHVTLMKGGHEQAPTDL